MQIRCGSRLWRDDARRMQLYSGPLSMFGAKAEIALHEKGYRSISSWCLSTWSGCRSRGFRPRERINPKRQVPVLTDGSTEIFDSTQIFEYLDSYGHVYGQVRGSPCTERLSGTPRAHGSAPSQWCYLPWPSRYCGQEPWR